LKAAEPRVPTWVLLLGVGFLDVLFGIFVLLGIERVTITPRSVAGVLARLHRLVALPGRLDFLVGPVRARFRAPRPPGQSSGPVSRVSPISSSTVFMHPPEPGPVAPRHGARRASPLASVASRVVVVSSSPSSRSFGAIYLVRARRDRSFGGRPVRNVRGGPAVAPRELALGLAGKMSSVPGDPAS